MNPQHLILQDPGDEMARTVLLFQQTVQRLQELSGGELDSVLLQGGGAYLLQDAQEKLRHSEVRQREAAATQAAILNALPANIALLDHAGVILSVNDGWRNFAGDNTLNDATYFYFVKYQPLFFAAGARDFSPPPAVVRVAARGLK